MMVFVHGFDSSMIVIVPVVTYFTVYSIIIVASVIHPYYFMKQLISLIIELISMKSSTPFLALIIFVYLNYGTSKILYIVSQSSA